MVERFERQFNHIDKQHAEELRTLEMQGCIYSQFWREEYEEFAFCRVQFKPREIVKYVDASEAYDEFLGNLESSDSPSEALDDISSDKIRRRVEEYNEWAEEIGQPDTKFSFVAFIGEELESLTVVLGQTGMNSCRNRTQATGSSCSQKL
jgi:hypothetical protein